MTHCRVQERPQLANETVEPLPVAGPLCDEHRARLLAGEDWELQGSDASPIGTVEPSILMGDSLRSLDQYVLLEPPKNIQSGGRHGHVVPLRVQRRGDSDEREVNLLIKPRMLRAVADFFQDVAEQFGKDS